MGADAKRTLQEFRSLAMEQGWRVESTNGGHISFWPPAGKPVFSGSTPSDPRAIDNLRAQLRRAGLDFSDRPQPRQARGFGATIGECVSLKLMPHHDSDPKPREEPLMPQTPAPVEPTQLPTRLRPEPGESLAAFVLRARKLTGLSQKHVIHQLNQKLPTAEIVEQPWISGVENNRYCVEGMRASLLSEILRISLPDLLKLSQEKRKQAEKLRRKGAAEGSVTKKRKKNKPQDPLVISVARNTAKNLGLEWGDTELPKEPLFSDRDGRPMTVDEEHWLVVFLANSHSTEDVARVLGRSNKQSLMRIFRQVSDRSVAVAAESAPKLTLQAPPPQKPAETTPPAPPTAAGSNVFVCPKCEGTGKVGGKPCVVPVCGGRGVVLL